MYSLEQQRAAKRELQRRAKLALEYQREQAPAAFKAAVKASIVKGLHDKQLEVIQALENERRFISLCCSRRAGKTYLLASLIILKLLDAGFNQAVFFVAPTMGIGKGLIWKELTRLIDMYCLGWDIKEHLGEVHTPAGASFHIIGMDKQTQTGKTRGFDIVLCLLDETQEYEHLLQEFLVATSPALTGRKGVFIAGGTPGIAKKGTWFDICHGSQGFQNFHWDIRQNTKNPRPGDEVLQEELKLKGYTWDHPTFQREMLGVWVEDHNYLVCEYVGSKNSITILPDDYGLHWKHVIGIDIGYNDACAWVVLAVDPYTAKKYVVYSDKASQLTGDQTVERTAALVQSYQTKHVVSDPGGGGKPFYESFNRKYAKELGCYIRAANKVAGSLLGSIHFLNTELRTERLQLLLPQAECLASEIQVLRWKDEFHDEILEGTSYPQDTFDALRYALMEVTGVKPKERPKPATREDEAKKYEDQIERMIRNRQAPSNTNATPLQRLVGGRF